MVVVVVDEPLAPEVVELIAPVVLEEFALPLTAPVVAPVVPVADPVAAPGSVPAVVPVAGCWPAAPVVCPAWPAALALLVAAALPQGCPASTFAT